MGRRSGATGWTLPTIAVDFTHYPLADEALIGTLLDYAHELVAQHALEAHVTAHDFQVGVADTGQLHPHQGLLQRRLGLVIILDQPQLSIVNQSTHS
jgi:hypothetical protein